MKKVLFISLLTSIGFVANAKSVDIDIETSCGEIHHISEIGDDVDAKDLADYAEYIDWVYCG